MAQIPYRANTQTSLFPLLSQLSSQTVIDPSADHTYVRAMNPSETAAPTDFGIPQVMYAHNVMPSTYGFQSVGFIDQYPAYGGGVNFENASLVISTDRIRTYVAPDYKVSGTLYFLSQAGTWVQAAGAPTGLHAGTPVSTATVNGVTYICVATVGTYRYTVGTNTLEKVTLQGLDDANVRGVVASSGYLITWSRTGVAWSSVNDPLDFVPSDISGAGAGEIQDAAGDIVFCQSTAYGFIVYTTNNAVSVTFSGNATFPFNFKAINAAGGIASSDLVCKEAISSQYAYTTNGMQQIYHTGGKTTLPFLTDFVAGQLFEDFNEDTNTFEVSYFSTTMRKKLTLVADRYLVLSYGMVQNAEMTHAIVIDIVQTRMGKLKIKHNACFELRNIAPEVIETPRRSIAFLQANGAVKVVDFNTDALNSHGVILYGKYQVARTNETGLEKVQLENVPDATKVTVIDMMSYDGKNFKAQKGGFLMDEQSEGYLKTYLFNTEAKSHTLLIKGKFNINGLVFWFTAGGDMT